MLEVNIRIAGETWSVFDKHVRTIIIETGDKTCKIMASNSPRQRESHPSVAGENYKTTGNSAA